MTVHAFDPVAATYDAAFTHHPLGRWLRAAVQRHLFAVFQPGDHVLELGCGTGEDAVALAQHGITVHATDASPAMLAVARGKATRSGLNRQIRFACLDLTALPAEPDGEDTEKRSGMMIQGCTRRLFVSRQSHETSLKGDLGGCMSLAPPTDIPLAPFQGGMSSSQPHALSSLPAREYSDKSGFRSATEDDDGAEQFTPGPPYDGAFSNFGALNCVRDRRRVARALAAWVRPGGRVVLVVMGPLCPWEWIWYGLRGRFGTALRRFRPGTTARLDDGGAVRVWYPSSLRLRREFAPYFRPVRTAGIGVVVPPSFARGLVDRRPRLFERLAWLDARVGALFPGTWLNDHYLIVLERTSQP